MGDASRKTVLITNGNIMSLISLKGWLDSFGRDLLAVFITTRLPSSRSNVREMARLLLASGGRYTYFKLYLNRILPFMLKLSGRHTGVADYVMAKFPGVDVHFVADINAPSVVEKVKSYGPDLLVSFSATARFKSELLGVPRRLAVNAHYARLPAYAGLSPYYWYLHNGEKTAGCTLHVITDRLDAGSIIEQREVAIGDQESVVGVLVRQMGLISPMLNNFYSSATSEKMAVSQDERGRSYFRHPSRSQVKSFLKSGKRFMSRRDIASLKKLVPSSA